MCDILKYHFVHTLKGCRVSPSQYQSKRQTETKREFFIYNIDFICLGPVALIWPSRHISQPLFSKIKTYFHVYSQEHSCLDTCCGSALKHHFIICRKLLSCNCKKGKIKSKNLRSRLCTPTQVYNNCYCLIISWYRFGVMSASWRAACTPACWLSWCTGTLE